MLNTNDEDTYLEIGDSSHAGLVLLDLHSDLAGDTRGTAESGSSITEVGALAVKMKNML